MVANRLVSVQFASISFHQQTQRIIQKMSLSEQHSDNQEQPNIILTDPVDESDEATFESLVNFYRRRG